MITGHWPDTSVHSKQVPSEEHVYTRKKERKKEKEGKQKRNANTWRKSSEIVQYPLKVIDRLTLTCTIQGIKNVYKHDSSSQTCAIEPTSDPTRP